MNRIEKGGCAHPLKRFAGAAKPIQLCTGTDELAECAFRTECVQRAIPIAGSAEMMV